MGVPPTHTLTFTCTLLSKDTAMRPPRSRRRSSGDGAEGLGLGPSSLRVAWWPCPFRARLPAQILLSKA